MGLGFHLIIVTLDILIKQNMENGAKAGTGQVQHNYRKSLAAGEDLLFLEY